MMACAYFCLPVVALLCLLAVRCLLRVECVLSLFVVLCWLLPAACLVFGILRCSVLMYVVCCLVFGVCAVEW